MPSFYVNCSKSSFFPRSRRSHMHPSMLSLDVTLAKHSSSLLMGFTKHQDLDIIQPFSCYFIIPFPLLSNNIFSFIAEALHHDCIYCICTPPLLNPHNLITCNSSFTAIIFLNLNLKTSPVSASYPISKLFHIFIYFF